MKVSVVIPVYNTKRELFLRLLKSVLSQTETDFEVVIIDDGSKTDYAQWLDSCCKLDERIRISHYPNGGNRAARYRGIAEARGEWLYVCDSDDILHPQLLEYCLWLALKERADFVSFRHTIFLDGEEPVIEKLGDFEDIKTKIVHMIDGDASRDDFIKAMPHVHVDNWAQFISSSLAKSLPPTSSTSDLTRIFRLMLGSRVWVTTQACLYYYNQGVAGGITMSPLKLERVADSFEDWKRLIKLFWPDGRIDHKDCVWRAVCDKFLLSNLKIIYNWIRKRELETSRRVYLKEFADILRYLFRECGIPIGWCKMRHRLIYRVIMNIY